MSGLTLCAYAQENSTIITDRPTQSAATSTVGDGKFLIETGLILEQTNEFNNLLNLNSLFRYGLSDKIELRLTMNYDRISGDDFVVSTIGSTNLGAKVFLGSVQNSFADISVIGQLNLPTGEENEDTTGEIRFNFANQISDAFSLGYNLGLAIAPGGESELTPFYTCVLGASISDGLTAFIEPYGNLSDPADHRLNAGLIYLVSNKFQVDISGGVGLSEASPDSFIGFGAAIGF